MSMWTTIKRGFGYGLGGRIGWEFGGLIFGALRKIIVWAVLAGGAYLGVGSVGQYNDYAAKHTHTHTHTLKP